MRTNQTPEELAEECQRLANQLGATSLDRSTEAELRDAINRLRDMAASGAKDAERWNETLRHVGGARDLDGIERFSLRTIRPLGDVTIYRGSVAEHFTKAIDAAIAATKRG